MTLKMKLDQCVITQHQNNMKLPAVFVSHGSPMMAFKHAAPKTTGYLEQLGQTFGLNSAAGGSPVLWPAVKAILIISAHWESTNPAVIQINGSNKPKQIYDFYGFPQELNKVKYETVGSLEYAREIDQQLKRAGMKSEVDLEHGVDHGAWVPLMHMLDPVKHIPVIQVSLSKNLDFDFHIQLGRAFAPLREKGFLIVGSGGAVHNLGEVDFDQEEEDMTGGQSTSWALSFQRDLIKAVSASPVPTNLLTFLQDPNLKSRLKQSHPRTEHLMPLIVVAGACEQGEYLENTYKAMQFGTLSLAAFQSKQQPEPHSEL